MLQQLLSKILTFLGEWFTQATVLFALYSGADLLLSKIEKMRKDKATAGEQLAKTQEDLRLFKSDTELKFKEKDLKIKSLEDDFVELKKDFRSLLDRAQQKRRI